MGIDIGVDRVGHSLRTLVFQALKLYQTDRLFQFLVDPNQIVRSAAARELHCRPEVDEIFKYVSALSESTRWKDREIAAFTLGQIGTPNRPLKAKSMPILCKLCRDHEVAVRIAAVVALGQLHATEAESLIRNMLLDENADVRKNASEMLEWLRDGDG